MKKVYTADTAVNANLLKELLEDADIEATVQDERVSALVGGVPVVYPTVWAHDEDYDVARKIVAEFERSRAKPVGAGTWTCPKCGEQVEGHFKECWKCDAAGKEREEGGESARPARPLSVGVKLFVAVVCLLLIALVFKWRMSLNRAQAIQFYNQGIAHIKGGEPKQALADYTRALELDPRFALALAARADTHWRLGNLGAATSDIEQALKLAPRSQYGLGCRGLIRHEKGDLDGAIADYTTAMDCKPAAWLFVDRAVAYREEGKLAQAEADCTKAIGLDSASTHAFGSRGRVRQRRGDAEGARADFAQATRLTPRSPEEYQPRAFAWAALGEFDKALADCEAAREARPSDRWVDYGFACVYCMRAARRPPTPEGEQARKADIDLAFQALEKGVAKGLGNWTGLSKDDVLEILHGDPRFKKLVEMR